MYSGGPGAKGRSLHEDFGWATVKNCQGGEDEEVVVTGCVRGEGRSPEEGGSPASAEGSDSSGSKQGGVKKGR